MPVTERLILRDWRDDDLEPWAAMGQDREVMAHFPALVSRDEAIASMSRVRAAIADHGFGLWAVEVPGVCAFAGFCGIKRITFEVPGLSIGTSVEVGWRFARSMWGHGYATEGARAALAVGWERGLTEIVAFVLPTNARSAQVARRLGMRRDERDDFDHPLIAPGARSVAGDPQQRHHLYRIAAPTV